MNLFWSKKVILSYLLLILFISLPVLLFSNVSEAKIIYLKGTCSSGKSTLVRSIISQKLDIEIVDEDAIMHRCYIEAVSERFPASFGLISKAIASENLYHALREKDIVFKSSASEEECSNASQAISEIQNELDKPENLPWKKGISQRIDAKVINKVREAVEQKKHVLLDSWYIKPGLLNQLFPKTKIYRVLIYCHLHIAYDRLIKRNEEAHTQKNLQEKRYVRQLVGSFFSIYRISSQPEHAINEIRKDELIPTFETIALSLKEGIYQKPVFTFEEVSRPLFLKLQADFMSPFEKNKSGNFYISPKDKQDLIIDNSKHDFGEAVQLINNLLWTPL